VDLELQHVDQNHIMSTAQPSSTANSVSAEALIDILGTHIHSLGMWHSPLLDENLPDRNPSAPVFASRALKRRVGKFLPNSAYTSYMYIAFRKRDTPVRSVCRISFCHEQSTGIKDSEICNAEDRRYVVFFYPVFVPKMKRHETRHKCYVNINRCA
jgi:hypothetical protein